ncbi:hypothetical protein JCM10213_005849 [Rhodosporidiobolus nylandii]
MGFARFTGGAASALFRLVAYIFLRWIPGRFGPYLLPLFFLTHTLSTCAISSRIPRRPSTPAEAALVPSDPSDRPSFADVLKEGEPEQGSAVYAAHPHVSPSPSGSPAPASPNGSLAKRKKKKSGVGARDPLLLTAQGQASASDSEPGTPTTLTKRQKLPRNRPIPKASVGQIFTSLLFGTPTPTSRFLNWISWGVNAVIFLAAMDYIFTPIYGMDESALSFARIGAVSHDSVKLTARIPPLSSLTASTGAFVAGVVPANNTDGGFLPIEEFQGARLVYRPTKPLGQWIAGPDIVTKEEDDWVSTVKISGLWAATEYEYRLLRPAVSTSHHPAFPHSQTFTTFSDPSLSAAAVDGGEGTHYTFASSSCVKPGFPYEGPWAKSKTKGAEHFLKVAEREAVRFMLFLGDFIYSDVPWYAGSAPDQYFKRYRQTFASPEMKKMVEKIPLMAIYDDHEIYNDFAANETSPFFAPANKAYTTYLGNANPDAIAGHEGENYYDFRVGDSAFFVWDTRKFRSDNANDDDETKSMLGERQKDAFVDWARKVNSTVTWKFVISSVPLMSLWSHGQDTWASFTTERDAIMDILEHVPNVIVLSGDRHEFASAAIRTTVTEFSTSPFNMFYLPIRTLSQKHGRGATGEDVLLQYLPDGNSKFTLLTVDTRVANKPTVKVKVYIDGEVGWEVEVRGKPVHTQKKRLLAAEEAGLGALAMGWQQILTFLKRSWF